MPAPETAFRRQRAVWWPKAGEDAYNDTLRRSFNEILVRWVNGTRLVAGPEGSKRTVDATVITTEEIGVGDLMFEGSRDEWLGTGSGGVEDALMEVVSSNVTPDVKGRVRRRECGLVWFRDTPPEEEI